MMDIKQRKFDVTRFYMEMLRIRRFEELLFALYAKGLLSGTIHTCIGQEANAVGVLAAARREDTVFSSHRCHGHYIAHNGDVVGLLKEILGRTDGLCGGRGGSQHICGDHFYSNGVQGSYMPIALGVAMAEKMRKSGNISIAFIGDGTLGEGTVYETFNMASLYSVPLLVVIENNRFAQSTPIEKNLAGSIAERAKAFGLPVHEMESSDAEEIYCAYQHIIEDVRCKQQPCVGIIDTYRFMPHSKGDDFRSKEYLEKIWDFDPLKIVEKRLSRERMVEAVAAVNAEFDDLLNEIGIKV